MRKLKFTLCVLAAASFGAAAVLADDIKSAEKAIVDAMKKTKSFSATTKTETKIASESYKVDSKWDGTIEYRRDGETFKLRMEATFATTTDMGGNVTKSNGTSLTIDDGEFSYTYTNRNGAETAMKMKSTGARDQNPFVAWRESWNLKLLSDESVDGASCYVIEALPKSDSPMAGKMVFHYRKDCGQSVRTVTYDKDGKVTMKSSSTDVKVNPSLSDDRFVWRAPAGVEVTDMTAMGRQQETQQASEDQAKSDAKKKEEKKEEKKAETKPEKKKKGLLKLPKWKKKP